MFVNLNICSYHKNMNKNESAYGLFINKSENLLRYSSHTSILRYKFPKESQHIWLWWTILKTYQGKNNNLNHLELNSHHLASRGTKLLPLKRCRGETTHYTVWRFPHLLYGPPWAETHSSNLQYTLIRIQIRRPFRSYLPFLVLDCPISTFIPKEAYNFPRFIPAPSTMMVCY